MAVPLRATYRLQFHAGFTFTDAAAELPYLATLGISHLYASPILMSRPGSTHGYDGIDPTRIDPDLGGADGFRALAEAARTEGMGIILDIVPNHLAVDAANPFWMAALEFGAAGPAGKMFDIDWEQGRVTLPSLGKTLAAAIADGEITLAADWTAGRLLARYFDNAWPLRPETVAAVLQIADARDEGALSGLSRRFLALDGALAAEAQAVSEARQGLADLDAEHRSLVEIALARMDIAGVLHRQHWRLAHWRTESDSLTYRRFFNITGLVGLRVEDPAVFDLIHALPLRLLREGLIDGLRIDHVDGLSDPTGYCARLRAATGPHAIILVEKILGAGEALRPWPITGTTGYERLNDIQGLFVDQDGYETLDRYLVDHRLLDADRAARLATAKAFMLRTSFVGEVDKLIGLARALGSAEAEGSEFGIGALREAVIALLVRFPVYRSYGTDTESDAVDAALWQETRRLVEAHEHPWVAEAAAYLIRRLSETTPGSAEEEFIRRFQQLSGPAMAKGLEDTEFYRSLALSSANEVGGDLAQPWRSVAEFHDIQAARAEARALDLIPLATHDTKRGPDTRARINTIAEDATGWIARFEAWHAQNKPFRAEIAGREAPDPIDEWLIYQTLLGAWPISEARLSEYLTKAMREAKRHSFWDHPNEDYETAVQNFASALLQDPRAAGFRTSIAQRVSEADSRARISAIGQVILQMTIPGTPDVYQGTEFWDFSLVDPDNRRPVDYAARAAALARDVLPRLAADRIGEAKLFVTHHLLALRAAHPALFAEGDYRPLEPGPGWLGFTRSSRTESLAVIVPVGPRAAAHAPALPAAPAGQTWHPVLTETATEGRLPFDPLFPFVVALAR
ncbi:MAG TPA: malto-oligosyltrehalose synthase [Acidisoma sp.]|uniref:malto-oligosyltrehalose synthase n=1 Tax=Acidisoma sp. TaxID=1872115 RepID=UPI002D14D88A|nr:malto-oligosyltrehalose synthase [Acidisoma sp.]HTI01291.1 malto-oligosyltrehalose synthase [Acidisoma sp.]